VGSSVTGLRSIIADAADDRARSAARRQPEGPLAGPFARAV